MILFYTEMNFQHRLCWTNIRSVAVWIQFAGKCKTSSTHNLVSIKKSCYFVSFCNHLIFNDRALDGETLCNCRAVNLICRTKEKMEFIKIFRPEKQTVPEKATSRRLLILLISNVKYFPLTWVGWIRLHIFHIPDSCEENFFSLCIFRLSETLERILNCELISWAQDAIMFANLWVTPRSVPSSSIGVLLKHSKFVD